MAVSSAPVSPNPVSPALVTPMMIPENEAVDGKNSPKVSVPQKRSVGGFAYHSVDQNELDKRAAGDQSNIDRPVESFSPSDTDGGFMSGSESDSEYDVGAASDTEIQKRSIPEIWTRSPPTSPLEAKADVSGFDDNASIASADEYTSVMSDDESSVASADSFSADDEPSFASGLSEEDEKNLSNNQQGAAAVDGTNDGAEIKARSIDIGSQSERDGGRNYMSTNTWNA